MRTRSFPALGRATAEVGLGCWQLGAEWGPVSDAQADAVLSAALEAGVNLFDTADVYGRGLSERRVAARLARAVDAGMPRPVVLTKVGRFPDPGLPANLDPGVIARHVRNSRQRLEPLLRGAPIDLVQLHCVPPDALAQGQVFDALRRLRDQGELRCWGASVESVAEAELCLRQPDCASLQVICNVLRQTPVVSGLLDRAAERGTAVLARLPLCSGLLSGRMTTDRTFDAADHRSFNRDGAAFHVGETFGGLPFELGLVLVEELRALLPEGVPMAVAAMRWILDHAAVTAVIPGATRPAQVLENARASVATPLSPAEHDRLRQFWQQRVQPHVRGRD